MRRQEQRSKLVLLCRVRRTKRCRSKIKPLKIKKINTKSTSVSVFSKSRFVLELANLNLRKREL
jgi:hypothetical protein